MYNFKEIEAFAKTFWNEHQVYKVEVDTSKPKYYVLDMFPYPSGAGLHVGHPLGYIASDIVSRYKRQKGFNVLHPMGFDAFGLPAEQYAIQTGRHPADTTAENIARYKEQLDKIGFSFDWSREVQTCDPSYYKWTQWIFLKLFNSWYNKLSNKAEPIEDLVAHFNAYGTTGLDAFAGQEFQFSDDEWKEYSEEEQQSILMQFRLAYLDYSMVNWCPELGTVLANDEVKDGKSERGGYPVVRKSMRQWFLRITAYAERLLDDLNELDWSDSMKEMQRNWIGRSEGASVWFKTADGDHEIEIFTTRPDTIFGATFMVIAPEHELVQSITSSEQQLEVQDYLDYVGARTDVERQQEKKVTGAFTGAYAINPFNNHKMPIYISEYVLIGYGTGAIMAVPSDDDRDNAFADKFGLDIIDVIDKSMYEGAGREDKLGKMINSGFLDGMEVLEAIKVATEKIEDMGIGKLKVNYRLHDAGYSRQRYWGEPFPIIYKDGVAQQAPDQLPLELPEVESYKPTGDGEAPLARLTDWVNIDQNTKRETDTMPGYAGSSWYFLRYMDPHNDQEFVSKEKQDYWQDVDLYIGGTEHAVGHLMYSRLWQKVLFDYGLVTKKEPFKRLVNQGMIQGRSLFLDIHDRALHVPIEFADREDRFFAKDFAKLQQADNRFEGIAENDIDWEGEEKYVTLRPEIEKMSKSKFNVVNPDEIIDKYGSDVFRMFEMFLGPIEQSKPWDTKGIDGVSKFMRKFWALFCTEEGELKLTDKQGSDEEFKVLHKTIKKVTEDVERMSFNTCISAFMIATNEFTSLKTTSKDILEPMVALIAPFAPHSAEQLWQKLNKTGSVVDASFPTFEEKYLVESSYEYPVSINGKMRAKIAFPLDMDKNAIQAHVLADERISKWTEGKEIRKFILVPGRIINVVV
ncbi:MAG: leucine--tRNA ligase [Saprospiraceae bacterium]|nr:leucine--tRNA ligase [Saprospiraceae bacterium]